MENKVLHYSNGYDDYNKFQFDRISPVVEVFHVFPDGSHSLNLIPKAKLKALFRNLERIKETKSLMPIGGNEYRLKWCTGLGTDGATNKDYMVIYLEDLKGQSCEYLWFPEYQGGNE